MARLSIEDIWWTDDRRYKLANLMDNDIDRADGLIIKAWRISQTFWGNGRKKVPIHAFEEIKNHQLIYEVGLAYARGAFVYVRGTRQFHAWYAELKDSSSKGGKSKAIRAKQNASNSLANAYPSSSSSSIKEEYITGGEKTKTGEQKTTKDLIATYVDHYKLRYKLSPVISGREAGVAARIVKAVGVEDAIKLVPVYFKYDNKWVEEAKHNMVAFETVINQLRIILNKKQDAPKLLHAEDIK